MKRTLFLLCLLFGCVNADEHSPGYVTRFNCLDYFTLQQLECMEDMARKSKAIAMRRNGARAEARLCFDHSSILLAEQAYCLDDALDCYYE